MNREKINGLYKIIMVIILTALVTSLFTAVVIHKYVSENSEGQYIVIKSSETESVVAGIVDEYVGVIEEKYLGEINEQKLIDGAAAGLVDALEDPYSEYISKEEMDSYKSNIFGNYYGIGIYMKMNSEKNLIEVDKPIKGSPAEEVGILSGDLIISVEGAKYTAEQMTEAANAIKGLEGTKVKIEILRGTETLNFEVERREVKLNHVEGEKIENNIGYMTFTAFDEDCAQEFKDVYTDLKSKGIKSLIIDIRNNGGGLVSEALSIIEYIVKKDSIMLITTDKAGNEKIQKSTVEPFIDMPIIVLVNENTASASEILAGALQDHGKAKIVGTKTYGKGVIQQLMTLSSGSGLRLTIEEYCTPNRNKITGQGITPDEIVELPNSVTGSNQSENIIDTQLQKAIQLLK